MELLGHEPVPKWDVSTTESSLAYYPMVLHLLNFNFYFWYLVLEIEQK